MTDDAIPLDETVRLLNTHLQRILNSQPNSRIDRIAEMAERLFGVELCLAVINDRAESERSARHLKATQELSASCFVTSRTELFVVDASERSNGSEGFPRRAGDMEVRFAAGCPLHTPEGRIAGHLCLVDDKPREFPESDQRMLSDFAGLVSDELVAAGQVFVDELTGIANRRGFLQVANHLLPLCDRNDLHVDVFFFDLDDFKSVNDEFGHEAGDDALKAFAKVLIKSFRNSDVVARLGGDEFAVMMVGQQILADRALARMQELAATAAETIVTELLWSVGRVSYDPAIHDGIAGVMADADERMYRQKAKNQ